MCVATAQAREVADTLQGRLDEIVVHGIGARRNLKAPEMGRMWLDEKTITSMPVMFAEPDMVKTLQAQPGVSQGIEGFTGLYVRGGDDDQNLFIYQGLPLYHVSHIGGIFSSFNTATVQGADFYKSSFPAKFGGRLSSITDISMKEPDYEQLHGRLSLGLLSANAYITAPIKQNKAAFSIGLRRSWLELLSAPTLAIMNAIDKKKGKKHIAGYNFTDLNARLDYRISHSATASIIGYYGHDSFKIGQRDFEQSLDNITIIDGTVIHHNTAEKRFFDEDRNNLSWGNWGALASLGWYLGPGRWNTAVYYSHYGSTYKQSREYQNDMDDDATYGYNRSRTRNSISDIGVKSNYYASFSNHYQLGVGIAFTRHQYMPEDISNSYQVNGITSQESNNTPKVDANDFNAYIDNTFSLADLLAFSAGLRAQIYTIQGNTFTHLEPRLSARFTVTPDYSVKASYSRTHQCVQQVSSNYINLPTDLWQPITGNFKPLSSDQYCLGFYGNLPWQCYFSAEAWYKNMKNVLEYREGISILDPLLPWQDKLTSGKGWAYGLDLSVTKEAGAFTGSLGYGLMWNWRKFDTLNDGRKFPAKFDNRHKFNIQASYRLNDRISFTAAWTAMTGNRLTLALYNYDIPGSQFPDAPSVGAPGYGNEYDGTGYLPHRNNVRLPAYHRLDLGMTLKKQYKNGRTGVWNFSLYNAYCHMNVLTIKKDNENVAFYPEGDPRKHRVFKTLGFLPIIPSVSYTYTF